MTPAEVKAFNSGVEAMREVARKGRAERDGYVRQRRSEGRRIGLIGGLWLACKLLDERGAKLLRDAPAEAP